MARRVGQIIATEVARPIAAFLADARVAAAGAVDANGHVWASMLVAHRGFLRADTSDSAHAALDRLHVDANVPANDALAGVLNGSLAHGQQVGIVAIDFATRRRVRVNGMLTTDRSTRGIGFTIAVQQSYVNCPKYIRARVLPAQTSLAPTSAATSVESSNATAVPSRTSLSTSHVALISHADTAFIASVGPDGAADASHRGGPHGFIDVLDDTHLRIPDYSGNTMFNTLGNVAADRRVGLVVPDFASGSVLQLSGTAAINWRDDVAAAYPGAERTLDITIERVIDVRDAFPAGWAELDASPFNPPTRHLDI